MSFIQNFVPPLFDTIFRHHDNAKSYLSEFSEKTSMEGCRVR